MGVHISGLEMPRKGEMLVIFPDGTSYVCFNGMRERLKHTTAFPIPPHGRLIDADELHKLFIEKGKEFKGIGGAMLAAAAWCIANAPTVLEAEDGET